jgi:VPDSG-CTERM motif
VRRAFAMKTLGVLVLTMACWALPSKAMAVPVCGDPNANVLDYNAQGGCTIDGLLFSDFFVDPIPGSPNNVIAMGSGVVNGVVLFQLNPNLGLTTNIEDIHFFFKVSTLDGGANIFGVDLSVGGFGANVTESVCSGQWVLGICTGTLLTTLSADSGGFDDGFFAPRSSIWVFKDIGVQSGPGALSSFTQSFHVPDGGSTLALLGLGLMGLRAVRRRFPRR